MTQAKMNIYAVIAVVYGKGKAVISSPYQRAGGGAEGIRTAMLFGDACG
jgi:hypothetical protein